MSTGFIIFIAGVVLSLLVMLPFFLRARRLEKETITADEIAHDYGLKEPVTLHPVINPEICIGTGNCAADVCPESVLGLRDGQGFVISPARCVGHGLCERACPVEAISLVFGSEKRGVDIPRIDSNFETNVPGIFIVGELGGMGLIGNAFEQGAQCIDGIGKNLEHRDGILDVVVIGCGPAGLSSSIACAHKKLKFVTIEKEDIGGTVRYYPRKKLVMTRPLKVPGFGKINHRNIVKEELEGIWNDIVETVGLEVNTNELVTTIEPLGEGNFQVVSNNDVYITQNVVLAIGRRGVPRKLGVPGEDSRKVAYSLREPEAYEDDDILIVGGGDSAVEAALALAQSPSNRVSLSYRKNAFARIKPMNHERVQEAIATDRINVLWESNVTRINDKNVQVKFEDDKQKELDNDYVFVFIGGILPTKFLVDCGITIDRKFGSK